MRRLVAVVVVVVAGVLVGVVAWVVLAPGGGTSGTSRLLLPAQPSLSADGRYVVFVSGRSDLVPADTNDSSDVFIRDRLKGITERVSVSSEGKQGNDDAVDNSDSEPWVSPDGRYVVFVSSASNLVPGDTNGRADVFVRDRLKGRTERVSVSSSGQQATGPPDDSSAFAWLSDHPSMSADGRYVAFESDAANLVPHDTNGETDVFVRDRLKRTTERVSVTNSGGQASSFVPAHSGGSDLPSLSADGRFIVFDSFATDLVSGDTNGRADVFVRDRLKGTTELVSVSDSGGEADADSGYPPASVSADGRYVAFASEASNLVPGDTNGTDAYDVLVRDRQTGKTELISVSPDGSQLTWEQSDGAAFVSADGRLVSFLADLSFGGSWVLVRDRVAHTTTPVVKAGADQTGADSDVRPVLSANGRFVFYKDIDGNVLVRDGETGRTEAQDVPTKVQAVRSGPNPAWTITDLGTFGGSSSRAEAINDLGQIVVTAETTTGSGRSILWSQGHSIKLPLGAAASGINQSGDIVGTMTTDLPQPFLWSAGKLTILAGMDGSEGHAYAINEHGQVVGYERSNDDGAFLWQNGNETAICAPEVYEPRSHAEAINNQGEVVGDCDQRAFLWVAGKLTKLSGLGGSWSGASDINDSAQIAGNTLNNGWSHAYLWQNGTLTELGTLGGRASNASALNNHAEIVGESRTNAGSTHAFLWQKGKMIDLGTLPGGTESHATDINNHNQIVGWSYTKSGSKHAVLWTLKPGGSSAR